MGLFGGGGKSSSESKTTTRINTRVKQSDDRIAAGGGSLILGRGAKLKIKNVDKGIKQATFQAAIADITNLATTQNEQLLGFQAERDEQFFDFLGDTFASTNEAIAASNAGAAGQVSSALTAVERASQDDDLTGLQELTKTIMVLGIGVAAILIFARK